MFKTNRILKPYILIPWTFTICSRTIILWSLRNKRHQKSQGNTNLLNLKEHKFLKTLHGKIILLQEHSCFMIFVVKMTKPNVLKENQNLATMADF